MGLAFEITREDVVSVLDEVGLLDKTSHVERNNFIDRIWDICTENYSRIEKAALYGDGIDEQTEYAYQEIKDILRERGCL